MCMPYVSIALLCISMFASVSVQERPGLSVLIPVAHPSVDPTGRIHTSLLGSWVYGASRLSSAVAEAVAALTEGTADGRASGRQVNVHATTLLFLLLIFLFATSDEPVSLAGEVALVNR